jgi:hypothetical protein
MDAGKWSASCPGYLIPEERDLGSHQTGDWVMGDKSCHMYEVTVGRERIGNWIYQTSITHNFKSLRC